uniref:LPXTG-motif cell wall anchor domain protein n=1 Tax=Haemonchus contortus TaxID=6289 RepID=A0A7I5EC95_HAECO|nr:unnamed protein product [Haemonchus contortus]
MERAIGVPLLNTTFGAPLLNMTLNFEPETRVSDTSNWLLAIAILVAMALFSLLVVGFRFILRKRSSHVTTHADVENAKTGTNQRNGSGANNMSAGSDI